MTPEQFDALVSLVGAMIRADSTEARNSSDGGLIEAHELGEFMREARALLVVEPAKEIVLKSCMHKNGHIEGRGFNAHWSCCGEAYA